MPTVWDRLIRVRKLQLYSFTTSVVFTAIISRKVSILLSRSSPVPIK